MTEYAEKALQLSGKKANLLLITARILEHLPLTSAAYQLCNLDWAKLRALQTLLTPETEAVWLEYALNHRTDEVVRAVAMSPDAWKRQAAFKASRDGEPIASVEAVTEILDQQKKTVADCLGSDIQDVENFEGSERETTPGQPVYESAGVRAGGTPSTDGRVAREQVSNCVESDRQSLESLLLNLEVESGVTPLRGVSAASAADPKQPSTLIKITPQCLRLTFDLTPDNFAIYEAAEQRVRAQKGRRVARGQVLAILAERFLDSGSAKSRAKHQIVIHRSADGGQSWYETERGALPVSSEILRQAEANRNKPIFVNNDPVVVIQPGELSLSAGVDRPSVPRPDDSQDDGLFRGDDTAEIEPVISGTRGFDAASEQIAARTDGMNPVSSRDSADTDLTSSPKPSGRKGVPSGVLRTLFARAGRRCERCGFGNVPLHAHHRRPVCEGGSNDLSELELLCWACHSGHHEFDFVTKPHWASARVKATGQG